eukprot:UN00643
MASDMSYEEAQQAVDAGDEATTSEIQEMYPDKTMNKIEYDMAMKEAELEWSSKISAMHSFNKPRAAAKQGRKTHRTGSKGVMTDYEEAKLKMRANRLKKKIRGENKYYMNIGSNANETASKLMIIDQKKSKVTKKQLRTEREKTANSDSELDEEFDDLLDEEVLLQYKLEKMKILCENSNRYGNVEEITYLTFDKEVVAAPQNVSVVIHIYQDYLERCVRMNHALQCVAKSYPHVKFLRARSDRLALDTYPQIGLPTFIIFKNGKQVQNHIAVHHLIGNPPQVKEVEAFLIENKVIQPIVVIPDIKKKGNVITNENENDNDSDSELDLD